MFAASRLIIKTLFALQLSAAVCAQNGSIKTGPVYATGNNGSTILSVTESKEKTGWRYSLQLTSIQNGALLKSNEVANTEKQFTPEQVIGKLGNLLWIFTDSLCGYNTVTLEKEVTESSLAALHPVLKNNFARVNNSYLLDEGAQVLYLHTADDKGYKLYPGLRLQPDNSRNEAAPDDYNYEFAAGYNLYGRYSLKNALTCTDTLNNQLYIIGSKKETGQILSFYGSGIFSEQDVKRQLTIIPFSETDERMDFSKNKPRTVAKQYPGAALLTQKFYTGAWQGPNGEHLLIYRNGKGSSATLCVAMVDNTGKEQWNYCTGIAALHFNDYLVTPQYLAIWMDVPKNGAVAQQVFYITLQNGVTQKTSL